MQLPQADNLFGFYLFVKNILEPGDMGRLAIFAPAKTIEI